MSKKTRSVRINSENDVSERLQGSYGRVIVLMSSNPEEIDLLCSKLDGYSTVMDTEVLDNYDYAKVIIRDD